MKNILKISLVLFAVILCTSGNMVQGQELYITVTDQHTPGPYSNNNTRYVAQWVIQDVNTLVPFTCTPNTESWYFPNSFNNKSFAASLNASSTYVLWVQVTRYDFGNPTPVTTGLSRSDQFLGSDFIYTIFYMSVTLPQ